MIVTSALLLCFVAGCGNKAVQAELEGFNALAEVETQNKALVREYWGRFGKGENDKAVSAISHELHASDMLFHMSQKNFGLNPYEALSDIQTYIEKIMAEGEFVVIRLTFKGTHSKESLGIPATGKQVSYPVQIMYRFQEGKAKEAWSDWDSLFDLMQQVGMELKPSDALLKKMMDADAYGNR